MDASDGERGELLECSRAEVKITLAIASCTAVRNPDGHRVAVHMCGEALATNRVIVRVSGVSWEVIEKTMGRSGDEVVGSIRLSTSAKTRRIERRIASEHLRTSLKRLVGGHGRTEDRSRQSKNWDELESEHCSMRY